MIWFNIYIALVIACLVACSIYRKFIPRYYKYFQILLSSIIVFEVAGYLLPTPYNNILDHLYQPFEFTFISLIYRETIKGETFKNCIKYLIPIFWVVAIILSVAVEGITSYNTYSFILGSVIIIFYGLRYIYELYDSPPETNSLLTVPFFWINTGNLFFYCGTFFQMGLNSYIDSLDPDMATGLQVINKALNYALYIFYFIGFVCRKIFR